MRWRAFLAATVALALVAACDHPGLYPATPPATAVHVTLAPDAPTLEALSPNQTQQFVVSARSDVTDAALVVVVRGRRPIRVLAVRPQVEMSPRTPVTVIDTRVRPVSPNGTSEMIGLRAGWPPAVNPLELAQAAGTPLYPRDTEQLAYEVVIGLTVSAGPAHVTGVLIIYDVDGITRSTLFPQDITLCIAEGGPTFGDTIWSKGCPGNERVRTG